GIAPFGRQRAGGQSRTVPADPGRGLAGGAARGQAVCQRALVRALERGDRQDAVLGRAHTVRYLTPRGQSGRAVLPSPFFRPPVMPAMSQPPPPARTTMVAVGTVPVGSPPAAIRPADPAHVLNVG